MVIKTVAQVFQDIFQIKSINRLTIIGNCLKIN